MVHSSCCFCRMWMVCLYLWLETSQMSCMVSISNILWCQILRSVVTCDWTFTSSEILFSASITLDFSLRVFSFYCVAIIVNTSLIANLIYLVLYCLIPLLWIIKVEMLLSRNVWSSKHLFHWYFLLDVYKSLVCGELKLVWYILKHDCN